MDETPESANVPAQIANAVAGIPKSLVPASIKALDRLIGATVDIPVAWLAQQRAKIDAQTQAYTAVEAAIAKAVASEAGADAATVEQAFNVLVRKTYRKHVNRAAVGAAMLEDLRVPPDAEGAQPETTTPPTPIDEDWLNVFERYAEDASTERMQRLWGRVLAGQVRSPGKFSMRTLRFLSEFSQADALSFAAFCNSAFGDAAPDALVKANLTDIRHLIYMESAGLLQGASGFSLNRTLKFNENGASFIIEGNLVLLFHGTPLSQVAGEVVALTPLGQELISLLPERDARAAARTVALAMRTPEIKSAFLAMRDQAGRAIPMEVLWQEDLPVP